jgi:multidrug resistance efflux pump
VSDLAAEPTSDALAQAEADAQAKAPGRWVPPTRSRWGTFLALASALLAVLAILYAWQLFPFAGNAERTDNAYVKGSVTIISPQVSGYVTSVPGVDFTQVRQGEILATIDDRVYLARVGQARANVAAQNATLSNAAQAERSRFAALGAQDAGIANAQAQRVRAQADMRRADALVSDGSISAREHDQTRAALQQAQAGLAQARSARLIGDQDIRSVQVGREGLRAGVDAAEAQLRLAQIDLDNTIIRAPIDGQLSEIGVRRGAFVTAGTQLMFLVPRANWVIANFKEAQTRDMRVGQRATFTVDALGGAELSGRIESIAPAAGSEFTVLKADNATGNFVKVAQRIAVRIGINPAQVAAARLRPGMSVEARIVTVK